jgi:hypothetical protein
LAEEGTPWLFVALCAGLLALLAGSERYCGRLVLPAPEARE